MLVPLVPSGLIISIPMGLRQSPGLFMRPMDFAWDALIVVGAAAFMLQ